MPDEKDVLGKHVKILADKWPSGLIGAVGCDGNVIEQHIFRSDVVKVHFPYNDQRGWFYIDDLQILGDAKCYLHDFERFTGFLQITDICRKCGHKEPVNLMKKD